MCMYVSEIYAEGIFVSFAWWLENLSEVALSSNDGRFEVCLQKLKNLHFAEENYLNYTKTIIFFHVTIKFSPEQGGSKNRQWNNCDTLKLPYHIIIKTKKAGFLNIEQGNVLLKNEYGADHPWLHAVEDCVQNQDVIST